MTFSKQLEQYKEEINELVRAYKRFFSPKNKELGKDGQKVIKDLAKFCAVDTHSYHSDGFVLAQAEGRRQVFNYILNQLNMDFVEIDKLLNEVDYE